MRVIFVVRHNGKEARFNTVQERDRFADTLPSEPVRGFIIE